MADYPALPLWTDAYIADTMHMGCLESGAYLHLLMAAWRSPNCTLPDDDKMLGRMARCTPREWAKVRAVVMNFWTHDEKTKTWSQKRLLKEREYVRVTSGKAKHAAETRWLKNNDTYNANASPEHMPEPPPEHMPDACSADAPIPIPTIADLSSAPGDKTPRETTELEKREVRLICEAFNAELEACFADKAPLPHATNFATALQMVRGGATADMARPIIAATLAKMAFNRKPPPRSLNYFTDAVADALRVAAEPMPKGNPDAELVNIPRHLDRRGKRTSADSFDDMLAAARGVVAGG